MIDTSPDKHAVSILKGEFVDPQVERDYMDQDMSKSKRFLLPLLLFFATLYFLFIIPDYINLGFSTRFYAVLFNRVLVVTLVLILYFKLAKATEYDFFYRWIPIYEIIVFASFIFTLLAYENPNILIQTFGIMLIIISLFLVPSRWLTTFLICLGFILAFHNISGLLIDTVNTGERYASLVFLLIVLIISGMASLRTHYYKRVQYYQEKKLFHASRRDPLTGCYNRLILNEEFAEIYSPNYQHKDAAIILFDLDNFKSVNDEFGHLNGDKVLIEIVELFTPFMDQETILVRFGGEEFLIFLKNANLERATLLAKGLKQKLKNHTFQIGTNITCSFGVASKKECSHINELLNTVDKRMYKAKALGKDRVVSSL